MKNPGAVPHGHDRKLVVPRPSRALRLGIGVVLFLAWGIETILWVWTNIHLIANGDVTSAVTAVGAVALLVLLAGMEGLEVSVIDRWQKVWPGKPTSHLASWLAARQLFVALIVTTATLLANRSIIFIPGTSGQITGGFTTGVFDLTWIGLTVLWFAQIFPKHLGATNPDRYLANLQRVLFPLVAVVHFAGVSQPGEWTANVVEYVLDWPEPAEAAKLRRPAEQSLAEIWRELRRPHRRPADPGGPKPI